MSSSSFMKSQAPQPERFIAFLKGINVGGHTVKMERLRRIFEEMGFDGVESYIASGNIIFSSAEADARRLEFAVAARLREALGYPVATFIRTDHALSSIAAYRPFADSGQSADGNSMYIVFLPQPPEAAVVDRLHSAGTASDEFRSEGSEVYWLCRTRFSDSPFSGPALEKILRTDVTVRNSTTVRKLAERYSPS